MPGNNLAEIKEKSDKNFKKGLELFFAKKYVEAKEKFASSTASASSYYQAKTLSELGQHDDALKTFETLLINSKSPFNLINKANALYHSGEYSEALKILDELKEYKPEAEKVKKDNTQQLATEVFSFYYVKALVLFKNESFRDLYTLCKHFSKVSSTYAASKYKSNKVMSDISGYFKKMLATLDSFDKKYPENMVAAKMADYFKQQEVSSLLGAKEYQKALELCKKYATQCESIERKVPQFICETIDVLKKTTALSAKDTVSKTKSATTSVSVSSSSAALFSSASLATSSSSLSISSSAQTTSEELPPVELEVLGSKTKATKS